MARGTFFAMTTSTAELSPQSQNALKYVAHAVVLALWFTAGCVFGLRQLFLEHGLGVSVSYWLWFTGFVAVSTFLTRFVKSAVGVLAVHAGLALALSLLPTAMPFGLLRAGYDLLLTGS